MLLLLGRAKTAGGEARDHPVISFRDDDADTALPDFQVGEALS